MNRWESLAAVVVSRRWWVVGIACAFLVIAGAVGADAIDRLSSGGFDDPGSESVRADAEFQRQFGLEVPNYVLLVDGGGADVDRFDVAAAARDLVDRLGREPGVERVESYWTSGPLGAQLRSRDGKYGLVRAQLAGDDNQIADLARTLTPKFSDSEGPIEVSATGYSELLVETEDLAKADLLKSEAIALPLTLIALFFVFRGLVAALLPVAIGVLAIAGSGFALKLLGQATDVSVFGLNLATSMGLALAIDYSLLIVARYRQERERLPDSEAIARALGTAGRTVAFSAVTVAVALCALLVFPMYFLRSFAYAGVVVVAIAAAGALLVLPALLAILGNRVDAWSLPAQRRRRDPETGVWHRISTAVMRRPVPIAVASTLLLVLLAAPFLNAKLVFPDDRNLPASSEPAQVSQLIRTQFELPENGTLFAVTTGAAAPGFNAAAAEYVAELSQVPGVTKVHGPFPRAGAAWFAVQTNVEPLSPEGEHLVHQVRGVPTDFDVDVTGLGARTADAKDTIMARLPLALAIIAITMFLTLLVLTRSVVLPIKALVLNTLSLTATFGALVFIFQDGHLRWLVGDFTVTGTLNLLTPPLLFCVAFGLSMDYEVFMLSRIKEERDNGADNVTAVARGLEATGPVITAAAAVMAIVFASLATSGVTGVKSLGIGLALAVLIDVTVVRALLVPAFMRLAGKLNWVGPGWLSRNQRSRNQRQGVAAP